MLSIHNNLSTAAQNVTGAFVIKAFCAKKFESINELFKQKPANDVSNKPIKRTKAFMF